LVESNDVGLAPLNKVKIKHVDQSFMITLLMMDRKTRKKKMEEGFIILLVK